jgi:hypothetical protein
LTKKVTFGARPKPAAAIDPVAADAFVSGGSEQQVVTPTMSAEQGTRELEKKADKPKPKRLTIDLDPDLHLRLKTLVPRAGTTIADLARDMFSEWADKQEGKAR